MNMDKVIKQVLRGDYFRLPQAFYGYGKYTDYAIKPRGYDISKVELLMKQAGWHRGPDGIRITSYNVCYTKLLRKLAVNLKTLVRNLELDNVSGGNLFACPQLRITSYNVCYTKLLRTHSVVPSLS